MLDTVRNYLFNLLFMKPSKGLPPSILFPASGLLYAGYNSHNNSKANAEIQRQVAENHQDIYNKFIFYLFTLAEDKILDINLSLY